MLLSWGWNEHGMCDGTETDVKGPKPISKLKNMKIIEFGTGYGHSFALCFDLIIYQFSWENYYSLLFVILQLLFILPQSSKSYMYISIIKCNT